MEGILDVSQSSLLLIATMTLIARKLCDWEAVLLAIKWQLHCVDPELLFSGRKSSTAVIKMCPALCQIRHIPVNSARVGAHNVKNAPAE
jgi:hypothetical protein